MLHIKKYQNWNGYGHKVFNAKHDLFTSSKSIKAQLIVFISLSQ